MMDGQREKESKERTGSHACMRRAAATKKADHSLPGAWRACLLAAATAAAHHPSLHLKRADGGAEAGGVQSEIKSI
jgi:hypothetical protein